jgi:hypothetical protein
MTRVKKFFRKNKFESKTFGGEKRAVGIFGVWKGDLDLSLVFVYLLNTCSQYNKLYQSETCCWTYDEGKYTSHHLLELFKLPGSAKVSARAQ